MDLIEILTRCRPIVERHHQQTEADLLAAIDAAIASPVPVLSLAEIERLALAIELPVCTVARVLVAARADAPPLPPVFDLIAFLEELTAWQAETFGPRQTRDGVIRHILKEVTEEIALQPGDLLEWIGLLFLTVSGMTKDGGTPRTIAGLCRLHLAQLRARTWPDWRTQDPDDAIEHDRSVEAPIERDILHRLKDR